MVSGRSSAEVTLSAPMGKRGAYGKHWGIGHQMNFRHMALHSSPVRDVATALEFKLRNLGLDSDNARAFLSLFKWTRAVPRGGQVLEEGRSQKVLTALLSGVACRYRITDDGRRQILNFQYSGDFCRAYPNLVPERSDPVAALTDCLVTDAQYDHLEQFIEQHPQTTVVFLRNSVLEARIFEERFLNGTQRPALERVAHLLCEHIYRLRAVDIVDDVVPLTQIDLADAAGLSVVHVNRTIQDLRNLGALSKDNHGIRVENKDRLAQIAKFDASYLAGIWARSDMQQEFAVRPREL